MEGLDYWRLCDELNVFQAALLIAGCDPSGEVGHAEDWLTHQRPTGYEAAMTAMKNAILSGALKAVIRRSAWERGWDEEPQDGEYYSKTVSIFLSDLSLAGLPSLREGIPGESIAERGIIYRTEPDWKLTTIPVDALRKWLFGRGFRTGFFFPEPTGMPDYLDSTHPRYAPKLAGAIQAWLAVDDPKGKTPKQALSKWLREHAAEFRLSDEDGKPFEQGLEDCAKVANWQPTGGAPKTPGA